MTLRECLSKSLEPYLQECLASAYGFVYMVTFISTTVRGLIETILLATWSPISAD